MPDLINRDEAIEKLMKIQAEHRRRTCSRTSLMQADAIGYAIEIVKRLPSVSENT